MIEHPFTNVLPSSLVLERDRDSRRDRGDRGVVASRTIAAGDVRDRDTAERDERERMFAAMAMMEAEHERGLHSWRGMK